MPKIALILEYDGSSFHGWQFQPDMRSVQEEVHKTLEILLREKIHCVYGSGRTDSGVHARGQVAHFETTVQPDLHALKYSLSAILQGQVAARAAFQVHDDFHAQESALRKCYSYTILHRDVFPVLERGRVWHMGGTLAIDRMREELSKLVGVHDFTSVRAVSCQAANPVRRIDAVRLHLDREYIKVSVVGNGFLKNMVRIIVGTLVEFGQGKLSDGFEKILESRNRDAAGVTAPPQGLCLEWVQYPKRFAIPMPKVGSGILEADDCPQNLSDA